jgi:NAD(P)-dependent dehydrogenase (short-subunit alcohol dehydrogenase family)
MDIRFDGKVAIVTGASLGIGKATALEFAKNGASVVVNYFQSKDSAEQIVEKIKADGGNAIAVRADVSKSQDVQRLINTTLDTFGEKIDILVNNAGSLIERRLIQDMTEELWEETMDVNLKSVYLCSSAIIPIMKKNNYGRIINLSSIAARNGGSVSATHYSSAKSAVLTFTKGLAKELANTGITVNGVAPGVITTPFHEKFSTTEIRDGFIKMIPLGREGTPEEIAYVILFLASEYSSYMLGETIEVNGGMWMD